MISVAINGNIIPQQFPKNETYKLCPYEHKHKSKPKTHIFKFGELLRNPGGGIDPREKFLGGVPLFLQDDT